MLSVNVLIDALVEEDVRLRDLVASCPPDRREIPAPGRGLNHKETLAHLAGWDDFTAEYFETLCCGDGHPPSFEGFVASSPERQRELCTQPFAAVLETYNRATRRLLDLLRRCWESLSEEQRRNLFLTLRHRRHHRRKLQELLPRTAPAHRTEGLADAAGSSS